MYIVSYDVAFVPRRCKRRCKKFHMNVNADVNADVSYRHMRHFASPFDDTYRHIPPFLLLLPISTYRHMRHFASPFDTYRHRSTYRHIVDTYPPFFLLQISTYRHNTYRHRARPILPPSHIPLFLLAITCIGYFNLIIFALQ